MTIKERDQIASDFQIVSLAQSPKNNSITAQITLHYSVLLLLFLSPFYSLRLTKHVNLTFQCHTNEDIELRTCLCYLLINTHLELKRII